MSLEQFRFVKSARPAAISSAVDSEDQTEDACKSDDLTAPPSKRRHFNTNWTEGCTRLKHEQDNSMMLCGVDASIGMSTETNLSKGAVQ